MTGQDTPVALIELIMSLRSRGIKSRDVLSAMEKTPRELFVAESYVRDAYRDQALPIPCGQTISQPFIVALMTQALEVGDTHKVLEIGTGCGYQTAILARLARRVYTIERYRTLRQQAEARFARLKLTNITSLLGDGLEGWAPQAPFDRIIVTAAAPEIPETLKRQLADGGIMVIPLGGQHDIQKLTRVTRKGDAFETEFLTAVRFVPLVSGKASEL